MRSNERMAATLRRALENAATGEDRRLRELIRQIQQLALACRTSPPPEDGFCDLAGSPDLFTSFSRAFWQPDVAGHVAGDLTFASQALDWEMVNRFRGLVDLNVGRLRDQVRLCLVAAESVLLSQVLERFPPREGILEIVGYLVVAMQDSQHYVPGDQFADVSFEAGPGRSECWRVPEVLFTRAQ